jgi:hypothetical protein
MLPGVNLATEGQNAMGRMQANQNSRVSPEVQAQRAAAARIARLQAMHAQMMQAGNVGEAEQVQSIIQSLQPRMAPGAAVGADVGRMAANRNAFAGMGSTAQRRY